MVVMEDTWNSGYVSEIDYTHGYYRELAPSLLSMAALAQGFRAPDPDQPMTYCELGCGQGLSMNILASANPHIEFFATDFNPSQIAGAKRMAQDAGLANVHFFDDAFDQFIEEQSLPQHFDIISLHGIYSWVSEENRSHIVNFLSQKLRPGGLVYISYNALPAWASAMPLRQLLVRHAEAQSGPLVQRINKSIEFAKSLSDQNSDFFNGNPAVKDRLKRIEDMPRNYLAHEYFNRDWSPFYFEDVVRELSNAKLTYMTSAHLIDHIDAVNLTADQSTWLSRESDPIRRQGLRDYIVNQQFRRDIFVKGAESISLMDSRDIWASSRFALSAHRDDIPSSVTGRLGEMNLQEEVYGPILDGFAAGPATLNEILQDPKIVALGWSKILQAVSLLVGWGHLQPCLAQKNEKKRKSTTAALNKAICNRAQSNGDIAYLASPVTGSGVGVGRFEQLYIKSMVSGKKAPSEWAIDTWNTLKQQGQKIQKDGKILEEESENISELTRQADEFEKKRIPILRSLQVI